MIDCAYPLEPIDGVAATQRPLAALVASDIYGPASRVRRRRGCDFHIVETNDDGKLAFP